MGIEIFVGSLIEHGSERAALKRVVQVLKISNRPGIILANVNLCGRQIDLIVALEQLTLVIEVKGLSIPVRGHENGPWQYRVASGGWKNFPRSNPNPYIQTIQASHAARDAMARHAEAEVAYPSAALVFAPSIPSGSSVPAGDFKAAIVGLDTIESQLQRNDATQWTFDQWRAFVKDHRLTPIGTIDAAFNPQMAAADELLGTYACAFQRTYQPLAAELVPFTCHRERESILSTDVAVAGSNGSNLLLQGPSGCGKTLVAYRIGLDCLAQGRIPVFIRAKDFLGSLRDAVNQEATLLDSPSAEVLLSACRGLGRGLVLIVDGYNECSEPLRMRLTRSIAAAVRRYHASIVLTTHTLLLQGAALLDLDLVAIPEPDFATKRAIALQASASTTSESLLEPLLHSACSGLEARLIGEVGRSIAPHASRYVIFDQFVRQRLGAQAGEGIGALARIAGLLLDRISFGLSVRDLERFAERERIPIALLRRLQDAKLLAIRGDRMSFGHELFLNAFTAEAIVRRGMANAALIADALSRPSNSDRKALIVGAIDDRDLLADVLGRVADANLIQSCLAGECGLVAQLWAQARQDKVVARAHEEISRVAFEISDKGFMNIRANPETLLVWTPQDNAVICALPALTSQRRYFEILLALAAAMDQRLAEQHRRLRDQASERKVALRSGLFANCYVWGNGPAASKIFAPIHSGMVDLKYSSELATLMRQQFVRDDLSPGQLYLLLALYLRVGSDEPSLASVLPGLLRRHWRWATYHLRLDLMHSACCCGWKATDAERRELVKAIQELPSITVAFSEGL